MIFWNGLNVSTVQTLEQIVARAKARKFGIFLVAGLFAIGLIFFLRGK